MDICVTIVKKRNNMTTCKKHGNAYISTAEECVRCIEEENHPQHCGECGAIDNKIIAQCTKCGCAICSECKDHEKKC